MSVTFESILGAGVVERMSSAAAVACGLPARAYTAETFFELECQQLFPASWVFVGFAHELATPGDAVPVTVAGQPIVLLRGRDGAIGVFHNVCRHRGTKLVCEPGNVGAFVVCPYHGWTYGLDGKLERTPHFAGHGKHTLDGFDAACHGLLAVRFAVLHDWIFVNLDGQAPPFEVHAEPLIRCMGGVDGATMTPVATLDFGTIGANWKALMENFIEPYHVAFIHSESAKGQPLDEHYTVIDEHCVGSAVDVTEAKHGGAEAEVLDISARYLTLFPNFVLGIYMPDQLGVHLNVPVGSGETQQRRVIYHLGDTPLAPEGVDRLKRLWRTVHDEDHAIVERLQAGRASAALADGGVLSPVWENSVRRFQQLVVGALT